MDTSDLIKSLSDNVAPVTPLPSARRRALRLTVAALAIIGLLVAFGRSGWTGRSSVAPLEDLMQWQIALMLLAGISASLAAFMLDRPDITVRRPARLLTALATACWVAIILACCPQTDMAQAQEAMHDGAVAMACLRDLILLAVAPLLAAWMMFRRAAPVFLGWAGYACALSVASFAAVGMRALCPELTTAHLLVWHYLPVLCLTIAGAVCGKLLSRHYRIG